MKYTVYPDISSSNPELRGGEIEIASALKLIENIQRELWGVPINGGNILTPMDMNLIINWIGGGIFQYNRNGSVLSSTFGISLPSDGKFHDTTGSEYSGCGIEYFIETKTSSPWVINLLISIASYIYKDKPNFLWEGMLIPGASGYIPREMNGNNINILCIKIHEIQMPGGKCEYLKLVPVFRDQVQGYNDLGYGKRKLATSWYGSLCNNDVFQF